MNQKNCKNCNFKTKGNYCHSCGQRTSINKVTFKETFQDFINTIFSIEAPIFLTIKLLIVNPGELFRNYLSGKRKTYYKPVSFFILTTIIFLLIINLFNFNPFSSDVNTEVDSDKINLIIKSTSEFFAKNINNILLVYVFTLGVFLKLFFYKKYSLAEYLAVSFYLAGFYTILSCISIFYLIFLGKQFGVVSFLIMGAYVIYALISFFKSYSFVTIIKIFFVFLTSFFFFSILGFLFSFFMVWLKNN